MIFYRQASACSLSLLSFFSLDFYLGSSVEAISPCEDLACNRLGYSISEGNRFSLFFFVFFGRNHGCASY